MIRTAWLCTVALSLLCSTSLATPPAAPASPAPAPTPETRKTPATPAAKPKPVRRAQKLDRSRSRASRAVLIKTVIIQGRRQRPLALFEASPEPLRFPVGTARYSPRDQRFLKNQDDRW